MASLEESGLRVESAPEGSRYSITLNWGLSLNCYNTSLYESLYKVRPICEQQFGPTANYQNQLLCRLLQMKLCGGKEVSSSRRLLLVVKTPAHEIKPRLLGATFRTFATQEVRTLPGTENA